MTELLSCPFCGGEAEIMTSSDGFTSIGCLGCNPVFGVMVQRMTREEAVELWNTRADAYTREDVEGAFVRGYSLGTLPVGSDPQWDENRQTVDEHMAELGWVRAATLGRGECRIEYRDGDYVCTGCGFTVGTSDPGSELFVDGNGVEVWSYCPNCGRQVKR